MKKGKKIKRKKDINNFLTKSKFSTPDSTIMRSTGWCLKQGKIA